jgi:hypothetical protein
VLVSLGTASCLALVIVACRLPHSTLACAAFSVGFLFAVKTKGLNIVEHYMTGTDLELFFGRGIYIENFPRFSLLFIAG